MVEGRITISFKLTSISNGLFLKGLLGGILFS
jgi:hypothetical protein